MLSEPARRGGRWPIDEFLRTGEADVARVLEVARALERPRGRERVLDFGCGVGRVSRSLADHFSEVVGVDISERMIEQARRLNADRPACMFVVNVAPDLRLLESRSFDLVYSRIVLQHLPRAEDAIRYVEEFLRVVRADGLVVFQLPDRIPRRLDARRRLYRLLRTLGLGERWLYGRAGLHPTRMMGLPEQTVRSAVEARGGVVARAEPDDASAPVASFQYYVHPADSEQPPYHGARG